MGTMFYVLAGPQAWCGVRIDHVCGSVAYFVGWKKGGFGLIYCVSKFYYFKRIIWWCLSVLKSILLEKIVKKGRDLPECSSGPPPRGGADANYGRPWNLIHSSLCRTPCRLFIHEVFFRPLSLHLHVWSELGRSLSFPPMRALRLQWSWAFSLVCEVALRAASHYGHLNREALGLNVDATWYQYISNRLWWASGLHGN
jgi:hypothetical protein